MTRADRPAAVRAWLRRPLFWAVVAAAFAVWLFRIEHQERWRAERVTEHGLVVQAVASADWDGASPLVADYVHPSGQRFAVEIEVGNESLLPAPGDEVPLRVAASDPTTAMVAGDRYRSSWLGHSLLVVPALGGWALRRWSLRQSARVAGSDGPAFQMRAVASSPSWWSTGWRLHLYPLDAAADALPVCTVPLAAPPSDRRPRTVEVKGQPRPWGRVMVRDQESGQLLWPSGRCLRNHGWGRHTLDSGQRVLRHDRARWWGLAALAVGASGMALDVVTDDYDDVGARSYRTTATVTEVGSSSQSGFVDVGIVLSWLGEPIEATIAVQEPPPVGDRIRVALDPRHPARVWGPGEEVPGGNPLGGVYFTAMALGIAAVVVRVRDRARARRLCSGPRPSPRRLSPATPWGQPTSQRQWRGIMVLQGRLWIGPQRRLTKRPRAWLEPDGPVLHTRDGDIRLRWEDGFNTRSTGPEAWRAWGEPATRASVPAVIFETGAKDRWGTGTRFRITGGWAAGMAGIANEPIPALLHYLADTPAARQRLTDASSLVALVDDLAAEFSWIIARHPPGEPFAGDRLDVHLAAERVLLNVWSRRFDGRPVRGEAIPQIEVLVEPVRREIPVRIRDSITDEQIRDRLARLLDVDPWPFDALVVDATEVKDQ